MICFFALRIQWAKATLEFAIDDAYFSIVDSEFFDPDYTEMYVEPNDEGINVIFSNITIIKLADPAKTNAHFVLNELSMGKYNKRTGVDVTLKLCEMLEEPVLVGPFASIMGLNNGSCPPAPGAYETKDYLMPDDAFPDTFGENKYVFQFEIFTEIKTLLAMKVFVELIVTK